MRFKNIGTYGEVQLDLEIKALSEWAPPPKDGYRTGENKQGGNKCPKGHGDCWSGYCDMTHANSAKWKCQVASGCRLLDDTRYNKTLYPLDACGKDDELNPTKKCGCGDKCCATVTKQGLAKIYVNIGTYVRLGFTFYKTETSVKVRLDNFYFSLMDFDTMDETWKKEEICVDAATDEDMGVFYVNGSTAVDVARQYKSCCKHSESVKTSWTPSNSGCDESASSGESYLFSSKVPHCATKCEQSDPQIPPGYSCKCTNSKCEYSPTLPTSCTEDTAHLCCNNPSDPNNLCPCQQDRSARRRALESRAARQFTRRVPRRSSSDSRIGTNSTSRSTRPHKLVKRGMPDGFSTYPGEARWSKIAPPKPKPNPPLSPEGAISEY